MFLFSLWITSKTFCTSILRDSFGALLYRLRTRWPNVYKVPTILAVTMETLLSLTSLSLLSSLFIVTLEWSEVNLGSYHITIRTYCLLCELLDGLCSYKAKENYTVEWCLYNPRWSWNTVLLICLENNLHHSNSR